MHPPEICDHVRRRLFAALLLTEVACDPGPSTTPSNSDEIAKVDGDAKPEPKPEPEPEPEPIAKTTMDPDVVAPTPQLPIPTPIATDTRPTCPSGQWCGIVQPPATGPDSVLGCPPTVSAAVRPTTSALTDRPGGPSTSFDPDRTKTMRDGGATDMCCYHWVDPCPGGRPLRDGERLIAAELANVPRSRPAVARAPHAEAAAAWLRDAGYEYASVASFARAAIELMAVGAPPALIEGCHRAAIDELGHAQVCSEIAWSLGATSQAPRRVDAAPPRRTELARLAVDTFLEGCVGETIAALALHAAAQRCEDPALREQITAIAADEERHAALAWRTLRWTIATGGASTVEALRAALAQARPTQWRTDACDPSLARCGRLDAPALAEVERLGWRNVVAPTLMALIAE